MFDLTVVAASLLPQAGAFAMVARLARLLRVTRLETIEKVKAWLEELARRLREEPPHPALSPEGRG